MFGRDARGVDPLWRVAAATPVFVADLGTLDALVGAVDVGERLLPVDGVLVARRHPTGWFVWAVRRADLGYDEAAHFQEAVTVRAYLLLDGRAVQDVWHHLTHEDEWRSVVPSFPAATAVGTGHLGT
jgi:hypothetical protein